MRIIKEDLTGCINRIAAGAPEARYLVIKEPINETGICKEFKTEEEAQRYIQEHTNMKKATTRSYPEARKPYHDCYTVTLCCYDAENDAYEEFSSYPEALDYFDSLIPSFDRKKHLALWLHGSNSTAFRPTARLLKQTS